MSIFSRIGKIIRSNLSPGFLLETKPDAAGDFFEDSANKRNTHSSQGSGTFRGYDQAGINHDPKLAKYYANLELPYGSDLEAVTSAWKKLLRKYHPDKHSTNPEKSETANILVQELNNAYQELKKRLS